MRPAGAEVQSLPAVTENICFDGSTDLSPDNRKQPAMLCFEAQAGPVRAGEGPEKEELREQPITG